MIVPTVLEPPAMPSTDQVTVGEPPPGAVAVYCCVCPGVSDDLPRRDERAR